MHHEPPWNFSPLAVSPPSVPLSDRSHFTDPRTGGPVFRQRYERFTPGPRGRTGIYTALGMIRVVLGGINSFLASTPEQRRQALAEARS